MNAIVSGLEFDLDSNVSIYNLQSDHEKAKIDYDWESKVVTLHVPGGCERSQK